jgi:hypothetical protein
MAILQPTSSCLDSNTHQFANITKSRWQYSIIPTCQHHMHMETIAHN